MSAHSGKHKTTTTAGKIHWSQRPRVTFDRLTAMLVDRNSGEALGRFREGGREYYTYLWYGGPKTFLHRLDVKLSETTLNDWSATFDALLNAAKLLNLIEEN